MSPDNTIAETPAATPQPSDEKTPTTAEILDLEKNGERAGYALDANAISDNSVYQLAKDGHTVLIPQPSDDPHDPLNWTWRKKHLIVFVISVCAFLPDYGSATGGVVLLTQSKAYGVSQNLLNHASAGNQFMIGAGGPIAVGLSAYFGRLPVLFWWMMVAVATAAGNAGASGYEGFLTTRVLNGFFATVAQGGGLMFLKDMFFFHEHARKINLWQSAVIVSPFFGPLFAAFIIAKESWYWPFIIYTIETALAFILVIFFVEETYYDRRIPPSQRPPRGSRLGRLVGTAQRRAQQPSNTFLEAMARPVKVLSKPVIVLTNVYYLLTFAWAVGINSTLAQFLAPVYQFTPTSIGYFYFIPIVATALGELSGHYIHDALASLSARRNAGTLHPEARLYVLYLATPFIIAGLLLLGFALEHTWHYMLAGLGFGLYSFGIMWCSVGVNAYLLDAYPEAAGEVAAWINFGRTTGGFIVGYFNVEWARNEGPARSFATQAGICAAAFLLVLVLQVWGRRLRQWGGPLKFKTS